MKDFRKMIRSPLYNEEGKHLLIFFDIIKKYYPDFTGTSLEKNKIFSILYPKRKYNDLLMRKNVSDMLRLAESFLFYSASQKNSLKNKLFQLTELREKKLNKLFEKKINEIEKEIKPQNSKTGFSSVSNYFLNTYMFEQEKRLYEMEGFIKNRDKSLIKMEKSLDHYYIIEKLRMSHKVINNKIFWEGENSTQNLNSLNSNFMESIFEYLENNKILYKTKYPFIYGYYLISKAFLNRNDESYFYELLDLIKRTEKLLTPDEIRYIYLNLQNYTIIKIYEGSEKYVQEAFNINKILEEKSLLFEEGCFVHNTMYLSFHGLAVNCGEYEWAEKFAKKYRHRLNEEFKDDAYNLAMSETLFHKKEYENVLKQLITFHYKNHLYYLISGIILLRTYYELNLYEKCYFLLDSLKHYITRKKKEINPAALELCSYFMPYFEKLLKFRDGKAGKAALIKTMLLNEPYFEQKKWLVLKFEEFENKKNAKQY